MCKYVLDIYEWIENKIKIYKHIRQMSINRHFFLPNKINALGFVIILTSVRTVATKKNIPAIHSIYHERENIAFI